MRLILTQPAHRHNDGRSHIDAVAALIDRSNLSPRRNDIVVLPELVGGESDHSVYVTDICALARRLRTYVVGGSHHDVIGEWRTNCGVVAAPGGDVVGRYEKANPYGGEATNGVIRGAGGVRFEVEGVRVLALICADFWYVSSFAPPHPDIVVTPAFSASQRPTPQMARARWRHAAIARAYELPAYIGISDWAHTVYHPDGRSSGAAGLAHPNPSKPSDLFRGLGRSRTQAFDIDLLALDNLRANRAQRNFEPGAL